MVSFSCESCGDVLTKKKLDPHRNQCRGASFTCLDCMVHFQGNEYRAHTSCISEAQKYQGALYRPDKERKNKQSHHNNSRAVVPHKAYVEDADDEYHHNSHIVIVDPPMPEAPEPPSAAPGFEFNSDPVNVFDFLVDATPNTSRLELPAPEPMNLIEEAPEENNNQGLVKVRFEDAGHNISELVEYGSGPIPTEEFKTPAPKAERDRERRREKKEREHTSKDKKDKKRKRLHVDTRDLSPRGETDEVMTDAPPVLHSGLTGGLNRLLSRPSVFPPSPDYSGGDVADASPGSPLKKTKHSKRGRSRVDTISSNLMSLISTRPSREHSSEERPKRKHRRHREASERPKMIEYHPRDEDRAVQDDPAAEMVVYKPRADLLLSYINKGPDSERGVSMNKALKRYHRDRNAVGVGLSKGEEEKELWRSLRMKRNDRGEIVLFL
ncbi:UPF0743 protein [Lachnellula hyalina]|uniref:UPF0743 protein n=1 Tax=Lachnellula hyalina TaxID=1316788 RepID=A0A8H8R375_9HELO|nr:UPF0743 protein [Lachnellula hyalina]TVY26074.1 UPF0743 protein [Lachnellula hyalina]